MSTRSRIGLEAEDGTILSIYCHFDGYPGGVGAMLAEFYANSEKIQKLLSFGDHSSLESDPDAGSYAERYVERGEVVPATRSENLQEFLAIGEEYNYLFRVGDQGWFVYSNGGDGGRSVVNTLSAAILREREEEEEEE